MIMIVINLYINLKFSRSWFLDIWPYFFIRYNETKYMVYSIKCIAYIFIIKYVVWKKYQRPWKLGGWKTWKTLPIMNGIERIQFMIGRKYFILRSIYKVIHATVTSHTFFLVEVRKNVAWRNWMFQRGLAIGD